MSGNAPLSFILPPEAAGQRFDVALAKAVQQYSRSRLQRWIESGCVTADGVHLRTKDLVKGGERIELTPVLAYEVTDHSEDIPLEVLHEDDFIIVINKPPGLVVHPAAGNPSGTLLNALLHRLPQLHALPRAGIVHRLDKDTSGALVVAKTLISHQALVKQLAERSMRREYLALVWGKVARPGSIDAPIGRHPVNRKRMAVVRTGRKATSQYVPLKQYPGLSLLKVSLETGRTHQIRVHLAHLRHAVVGDPVYGRAGKTALPLPEPCLGLVEGFKRQALHARSLSLRHPETAREMTFEAALPDDLAGLLQTLEPLAEKSARLG